MTQITEKQFQAWLVELLGLLGWSHLHVRKSLGRRGGAQAWQTTTNLSGWPDIFAWRERDKRQFAAELKSQKGVPTDEQEEVLLSLRKVGVETFIWRPSDRDFIEKYLK